MQPHNISVNMVASKVFYSNLELKSSLIFCRMYPVIVVNGRSLSQDTVLGGYMVPKGTHIIFPHHVVSNSEEYFEEPQKFVPERWIKGVNENCPNKPIHPFVSLPFGYGRRSCLGRRFAEMELQILLSKVRVILHYTSTHTHTNYTKKYICVTDFPTIQSRISP